MARTKGANTYSDKQMLIRLRKHLVDNLGSVWSMHSPTWQAYLKRMKDNAAFADKVMDIRAEADHKWEKIGLKALLTDNTDFNSALYKLFVGNKKSFLSHETLELDGRIDALEKANNG